MEDNKSVITFWIILIGASFGTIIGFTITPIIKGVLALLIPAFLGLILFKANKRKVSSLDIEKSNQLFTPLVQLQVKLFGLFIFSLTVFASSASWLNHNLGKTNEEARDIKNTEFINTIEYYSDKLDSLEITLTNYNSTNISTVSSIDPTAKPKPDSLITTILEEIEDIKRGLNKKLEEIPD